MVDFHLSQSRLKGLLCLFCETIPDWSKDRVSWAERRSVPIVSRLSRFRREVVKCTQRWVTSDSVAQRPSPQWPDSRLASVRVSRSASAPDVVDSFVDMSSGSVQDTDEACLPCLPLYPYIGVLHPHRVASGQYAQRLRSFFAISQLFRFIPSRL